MDGSHFQWDYYLCLSFRHWRNGQDVEEYRYYCMALSIWLFGRTLSHVSSSYFSNLQIIGYDSDLRFPCLCSTLSPIPSANSRYDILYIADPVLPSACPYQVTQSVYGVREPNIHKVWCHQCAQRHHIYYIRQFVRFPYINSKRMAVALLLEPKS